MWKRLIAVGIVLPSCLMKHTVVALLVALVWFSFSGCTPAQRIARADKKVQKKAPFDVVIVPGYPYVTAEYPYSTERNRILLNTRVHWAKELYDKGIVKNIIFSGAATHTPFIEGKIMKIMADSLGIPSEHTFVEDKALHSYQNAIYGKRLAKKMGFKNIAIATDPYQFAYLTYLVNIFTPGLPIITFKPERMVEFIKPLPSIDSSEAFIKDFKSID